MRFVSSPLGSTGVSAPGRLFRVRDAVEGVLWLVPLPVVFYLRYGLVICFQSSSVSVGTAVDFELQRLMDMLLFVWFGTRLACDKGNRQAEVAADSGRRRGQRHYPVVACVGI